MTIKERNEIVKQRLEERKSEFKDLDDYFAAKSYEEAHINLAVREEAIAKKIAEMQDAGITLANHEICGSPNPASKLANTEWTAFEMYEGVHFYLQLHEGNIKLAASQKHVAKIKSIKDFDTIKTELKQRIIEKALRVAWELKADLALNYHYFEEEQVEKQSKEVEETEFKLQSSRPAQKKMACCYEAEKLGSEPFCPDCGRPIERFEFY